MEFIPETIKPTDAYLTEEEIRAIISTSFSQYNQNAIIRGGYFQSNNFITGSAGWKIDSEGNAEFGSGKFRGDITGASGTFSGTITATAGTIGGWTIGDTTLTGGGITLDSSGIITGATIRTAASGVRTQLTTANDLELYENTTSSAGVISGDVAEIRFIRVDDTSKFFSLRKRVGKDNSLDNILELFPEVPSSGRYNMMFFGRNGVGSSYNTGALIATADIKTANAYSALNGTFGVEISTNGTQPSVYSIFARDARSFFSDANKSGIVSMLTGSGTNGLAGLSYFDGTTFDYGFYQNSTGVILANNMLPETTNTYDIGSSSLTIKNFYLAGNIVIGGTVDGVDIASLGDSHYGHIQDSNAHHSSTSNGLQITPSSVSSGYWIELNKMLYLGKMTGAVAANETAINGAMYYRTDDHLIRVYLNGGWRTITTEA